MERGGRRGEVATGRMRFDQQRPGRLARLGAFDGAPRGRLRVGGQAHPQRGCSAQLERLDAKLDDLAPDGVEPLGFVTREDLPREHGEHLLRRLAHRLPCALAKRVTPCAQHGSSGVDIDADVPLHLEGAGGEP